VRLRKIKYAASFIEEHPKTVFKDPKNNRGNWQKFFEKEQPLEIEVGCGKGKFILEMAKKYPNRNFIGIEKYDSVILRALEKYLEAPLPNVIFILSDAGVIEDFFVEEEVDGLYLNFSDPWPKKRQEKRRLTYVKFLDQYVKILKPNASVQLKTDNFGLFEYSMMTLNRHPSFRIKDISLRYFSSENVTTEFEEKFLSEGKPIYLIKAYSERKSQ